MLVRQVLLLSGDEVSTWSQNDLGAVDPWIGSQSRGCIESYELFYSAQRADGSALTPFSEHYFMFWFADVYEGRGESESLIACEGSGESVRAGYGYDIQRFAN